VERGQDDEETSDAPPEGLSRPFSRAAPGQQCRSDRSDFSLSAWFEKELKGSRHSRVQLQVAPRIESDSAVPVSYPLDGELTGVVIGQGASACRCERRPLYPFSCSQSAIYGDPRASRTVSIHEQTGVQLTFSSDLDRVAG
jgi:hypothetical protein